MIGITSFNSSLTCNLYVGGTPHSVRTTEIDSVRIKQKSTLIRNNQKIKKKNRHFPQ